MILKQLVHLVILVRLVPKVQVVFKELVVFREEYDSLEIVVVLEQAESPAQLGPLALRVAQVPLGLVVEREHRAQSVPLDQQVLQEQWGLRAN